MAAKPKLKPAAKPEPRPATVRKPTPRPKPRPKATVALVPGGGGGGPHAGTPSQQHLWKTQLVAAANKYKVPVDVAWGVYGEETNFGRYIDTSSTGAMGLTQFEPGTAASYGVPMTNYPDAQQSQAQFDGECHYLSDLYHQHGNSWAGAIVGYGGGYTLAEVQAKAASFPIGNVTPASGQPATVVYVNPLRHANVTPNRIDQGVDYAGTGVFEAFAACQIVKVVPGGWGKYGIWIQYQITADVPMKDDHFYAAEGFTPRVHVGQQLAAGDPIADFIPGWPYATEVGQAAGDASDGSWARIFGGQWTPARDAGPWSSRAGIAFSDLIHRLGGPAGIQAPNVYGDWPRWASGGVIPSTIQAGVTAPGGGVGPGPAPNPAAVAAGFSWPIALLDAFTNINVGALNGAHHSNSAWDTARGKKYVTAP